MGCGCSCLCFRRKYRKIDENVVLETNSEETWGIYWFREIPKVETKKERAPDPVTYSVMQRVHRFSDIVEKKVATATAIDLKDKQWKTLRADHSTGFVMLGRLGASQGNETSRLATMTAPFLYAEEVARAFWQDDAEVKAGWDPTMESFKNVEKLTDLAYVAHIVFKTIWPATQRDCVICSEMVPLKDDGWAVSNQSVFHPRCPEPTELIRLACDVTLVVTQSWKDPTKGTGRGNVVSHLMYSAKVDPGGWVPSSIVETLASREWPRALVGICDTARDMVKKQGIENKDFYVDCE